MATNYWVLGSVAAIIAVISFGVPLILAEIFPWRSLWKQRYGRPTVTTKSYKGRTALITGANGAFGSRAARLFAIHEIETLVLVDVKDCAGVKKQIEDELDEKQQPKPNILVWQVDMMSYKDCQALGKKARELKSLDHVLMTAGMLSFNRRESPEGWETCECLRGRQFDALVKSRHWLMLWSAQRSKSTSFPTRCLHCYSYHCSSLPRPIRTLQCSHLSRHSASIRHRSPWVSLRKAPISST